MKMKSKFFGLNAKLALAVLAVGTMFTSCYDSENGDVTQPYQAPDAVYTFTGTVTSQLTGKGVANATVTFSGAVTETVKTDATGTYQYTTTDVAAGQTAVNIVVSGKDFDNTNATVAGFKQIEKGQSIIFFTNVMVDLNIFEEEGLEFEPSVGVNSSSEETITSNPANEDYDESIDVANNTGVTKVYTWDVTVKKGSKVTEDNDNVYGYNVRALTDDKLKEAVRNRINAILGEVPQAEYGEEEKSATISLETGWAIGSVSIQYGIQTFNFEYEYDGVPGSVKVEKISSVLITPQLVPYEYFHGHSHGHGDEWNAGGGIINPEL